MLRNTMTLLLGLCVLMSAAACDRQTPDVVYIPKNTGNPYFDAVTSGFQRAARETGVSFQMLGPAQAGATTQLPMLKDQVQRGVKVIAISPNSPDALNTAIDDARARGVKVITVDADLTGNEDRRDAAVLQVDFDLVGPHLLELLGKHIDYEGEFAILSATTDAPNQRHWIGGLLRALADNPRYARMKHLETAYGDDNDQKSLTQCEALLTKYPSLRGIISPTTVGVAACAQAVKSAGVYPGGPNARGKGVVVVGLGMPSAMRGYIKDGIVPAVALWDPANMGHVAGHLAVGLINGTIKPAVGTTFDVPGLGPREFREKLIVIAGPLLEFNKENVDQYRF